MAESVVGPWAKDKLDRLAKYLDAYTTIMKDQTWCQGYYYIDAFAGPGEHEVRQKPPRHNAAQQTLLDISTYGRAQEEQQQFLAGSPRVALDVRYPFTCYVFIERSAPPGRRSPEAEGRIRLCAADIHSSDGLYDVPKGPSG